MSEGPYIENGILIVPFDSNHRFLWYAGGQTITNTIRELDRHDLLPMYASQDKGMQLGGSVGTPERPW